MKELLDACPGLAGDVARYIYNEIESDQPAIALGAALTLLGAIKSDRLCVTLNGRTTHPCIFGALVAGAGTGKTEAETAIKELLGDCNIDKTFLMGKPASDAALLGAMSKDGNNRKLLIWDEFGVALSGIANSKNNYETAVLGVMMEMFSVAGKFYIGKEYSPNSNAQRMDIDKPYLSVLAGSTPGRFFDSLNKNFIEDGFLPRWLIFFADEKVTYTPKEKADRQQVKDLLVAQLLKINIGVQSTGGNLSFAKTIRQEATCSEWLRTSKYNFRGLEREATNEIEKIFWRRAFEHTIKISLAICDGTDIRSSDAEFAEELVKTLTQTMIKNCHERLFDNAITKQRSEKFTRIQNCIPIHGTITKKLITRRFQNSIDKRERDAITSDLVESGIWDLVSEPDEFHRGQTIFKRVS